MNLIDGTTTRMACPICMKANSFSVTKKHGHTKWFCFHAECDTRGVVDSDLTKADICDIISKVDSESRPYTIPEHIILAENHEPTKAWLRKYNLTLNKTIDVRYDTKANRHLFMIWHDGVCYGGVGRSIDKATKPKWLVYGNGTKIPLVIKRGNTRAIVVEDALSAAKVPATYDGIALLGTHLSESYIPYLMGYDELFLALDADATDKAIKMHRQLSIYHKTTLIILKKDIKDMCDTDIDVMFGRG